MRMDPPRHRKLRGLVSQAFTRRMVAGLEPRIAEVTTELLDATGGGERLDLIESLAYPLPVIVIAELLDTVHRPADLPPVGRHAFRPGQHRPRGLAAEGRRGGGGLGGPDDARDEHLPPGLHPEPPANPGQDLTSKLLQAEVDGERLDDQEIVGFVGLFAARLPHHNHRDAG